MFAVSTVRRSWEIGPGCDMSWKNNDLPGRSGNQSVSQSVSQAVGWSVGWLVRRTAAVSQSALGQIIFPWAQLATVEW